MVDWWRRMSAVPGIITLFTCCRCCVWETWLRVHESRGDVVWCACQSSCGRCSVQHWTGILPGLWCKEVGRWSGEVILRCLLTAVLRNLLGSYNNNNNNNNSLPALCQSGKKVLLNLRRWHGRSFSVPESFGAGATLQHCHVTWPLASPWLHGLMICTQFCII